MLGKIFGILTVTSLLFGIATGNAEALGNAILDGASDAVSLTLSLAGAMCLWCGVMRVLQEAGAITRLARLMRPFLRLFFPNSAKEGEGAEEIASNIAANLLGMGNAATPLGINAMRTLSRYSDKKTASNSMCMLAVINSASIQLIPSTLIAIRAATGSRAPAEIMVPIWIVSVATFAFGVLLCKLIGKKNEYI